MRIMTYSETRANFAETLDRVIDDCEPVVITRRGHKPVVIISLAEYESLDETAYLMSSPANARMLTESIARLERGEGVQHDLIDP